MLAITLATSYFILLVVTTATAKGGRSPVAMTERGSSALVFLARNHRAGTRRSRAQLAHRASVRIWSGLRLSGTLNGFLCIHSHEGAWNSNTGNGYWGGLQMDRGFMGTYGSVYLSIWGTADRWPILLQLVAGYRAYHGFAGYGARGWSPWGTRGMCGL